MTEETTPSRSVRTDDAATTYRWDPDRQPCVSCGARVDRLWRDDDGLRCADCKTWS